MAEETLYDSKAMRPYAGIELGDDRIPEETAFLNFCHLLERHGLTRAAFATVNVRLACKGITLRSGRLVDATIIDEPSSTKRKAGARDPEMSSTKKGNDWYFGMMAHIGVDADSGVTRSLETSTGKLHDSQVWDALLHGEEPSVWADKGSISAEREERHSWRRAKSGLSCARPRRVTRCTPWTSGSIPSLSLAKTVPKSSRCSRDVTDFEFKDGRWQMADDDVNDVISAVSNIVSSNRS